VGISVKHLAILLAFLMVLSPPATAEDLDKGIAALQSGDYATAVNELIPLAKAGNASAQGVLGIMYFKGQGVLLDKNLAHMWFNISSANGSKVSREHRDIIAKEMTTEDIDKAQNLARQCMSSGYTKCAY